MREPGMGANHAVDAGSIAVLIPALNEALRIREVVQGALAHCPHVIVVDDGSDDGTADCIADLPVTLLRHPTRMGKGACLRDGFAEAMRQGRAGVLSMDGDGQHSADDIPRLLEAAALYPEAVVIGARLRRRSRQPLHRRLANAFGDWGIAFGCGYRVADTQSGQRYYPAAVCALGDLPGEDFVYEAQLLISAARVLGLHAVSVPIESRYEGPGAVGQFRRSHFRPLRDLWRITSHVVLQVLRQGDVLANIARTRARPPLIHDPGGEFASADSPLHETP